MLLLRSLQPCPLYSRPRWVAAPRGYGRKQLVTILQALAASTARGPVLMTTAFVSLVYKNAYPTRLMRLWALSPFGITLQIVCWKGQGQQQHQSRKQYFYHQTKNFAAAWIAAWYSRAHFLSLLRRANAWVTLGWIVSIKMMYFGKTSWVLNDTQCHV